MKNIYKEGPRRKISKKCFKCQLLSRMSKRNRDGDYLSKKKRGRQIEWVRIPDPRKGRKGEFLKLHPNLKNFVDKIESSYGNNYVVNRDERTGFTWKFKKQPLGPGQRSDSRGVTMWANIAVEKENTILYISKKATKQSTTKI